MSGRRCRGASTLPGLHSVRAALLERALGPLLLAAVLAPGATSSSAIAATASPPTAAESFALDSFRWRAEATPQGTVIATNEWGDLRTRTAQRGGLVVSAMIQKIGTTQDELEIRIDETADTVVIEVVPRVAEPRGRVDLTLIIPPGKRLEATTRDGLAEIKYKGDVQVRSRNGEVRLIPAR